MRGARILGFGLALVTAAGLTGCVRVPDQGPVVEANSQDQVEDVQPPFSKPLPPQKGAAADDIVAGFLEAMIATPLTTTGASEYLTSQARRTWRPDQVLAYSTNHVGLPRNDRVAVRLHGTERVGSRGQWVGRVPGSAAKLTLPDGARGRRVAHRQPARRPDPAPDVFRRRTTRTPPSTTSTRPAGSWCPSPSTCHRARSRRPWSAPCCARHGMARARSPARSFRPGYRCTRCRSPAASPR